MNDTNTGSAHAAISPQGLAQRSLAVQCAAVLLGTCMLAASSKISVPMLPVPVTMQTFAVTLIAALMGWRLGALTILAWLGEAALGLPVLASATGGIQHFAGPTAGYLFSFPLIGLLVGWLSERGWNGHRPLLCFASMLLANAICLVLGAAWLAGFVGFEKAIALGVTPFLIGGLLKSALAAVTMKALARS